MPRDPVTGRFVKAEEVPYVMADDGEQDGMRTEAEWTPPTWVRFAVTSILAVLLMVGVILLLAEH